MKRQSQSSDKLSVTAGIMAVTVVLATFILLVVRRFWRPRGKLPPGPFGLPVVGVIPFMDKSMQIQLTKWAKQYGSIYSMYLGPQLVVVLNDYDIIKTAYVDQAEICTGRPRFVAFHHITRGDYGIIGAEGQFWRDQRTLLTKAHTSLGSSGSRFEQLVLEETELLAKVILEYAAEHKPFSPRREFALSLANVACSMLFSRRFARDDKQLNIVVAEYGAFPKTIAQSGIYEVFPILRHAPIIRSSWVSFVTGEQVLHDFAREQFDRVVAEYDPLTNKREPRNDVEFMLKARADKYGDDDAAAEQDHALCMKNLFINTSILMGPPNIPIPRVLDWTVLTLLHHPDVQAKCYKEIVVNVGTDRQIKWADRASLPYCEAVLLESMRYNNVTPSAVPHSNIRDTYLGGYFIPKRTMLVQNLWNARWEEKDWPEARSFKPERFLTAAVEGGRQFVRENLVDFALLFLTGPRACPGQSITRMSLFLIFVNLVQRVEFLPPPNGGVESLPSLEQYEDGIETQPLPYKAWARARVVAGNTRAQWGDEDKTDRQ